MAIWRPGVENFYTNQAPETLLNADDGRQELEQALNEYAELAQASESSRRDFALLGSKLSRAALKYVDFNPDSYSLQDIYQFFSRYLGNSEAFIITQGLSGELSLAHAGSGLNFDVYLSSEAEDVDRGIDLYFDTTESQIESFVTPETKSSRPLDKEYYTIAASVKTSISVPSHGFPLAFYAGTTQTFEDEFDYHAPTFFDFHRNKDRRSAIEMWSKLRKDCVEAVDKMRGLDSMSTANSQAINEEYSNVLPFIFTVPDTTLAADLYNRSGQPNERFYQRLEDNLKDAMRRA